MGGMQPFWVAALLDSVPSGARFTGAKERIRSQPGISDQFRVGLQNEGGAMRVLKEDPLDHVLEVARVRGQPIS